MKHDRQSAAARSRTWDVNGEGLDVEAFLLDRQPEEWLGRVREAETVDPLLRAGSCELLCEVQRGGQGIVYRGRRAGEPWIRAIKRIFLSPLRPPGARERFERAVEAVSSLNHPFIVPIEDVEFVENHEALIIMPWIDGLPLDRWAAPRGESRRTPEAVALLFRDICEAIEHAHQRGVIHRDLKPSNILVDAEGHPHILDFGIARFLEESAEGASAAPPVLTLTAQFLGTIAYAAPEQLAGPPTPTDARSDVFAHHYGGAGGYPSDFWSNGRSPFPEYLSCVVMREGGYVEDAEWRRDVNRHHPDHALYWDLDEQYGFALFSRFFKLLRADGVRIGDLGEAPWPAPDRQRSLYTIAYLSIAAERNLAAIFRAAGAGREPEDWMKIHPEIPFLEYDIRDEEIAAMMAERERLFGPATEARRTERALRKRDELESQRERFRKGALRGNLWE